MPGSVPFETFAKSVVCSEGKKPRRQLLEARGGLERRRPNERKLDGQGSPRAGVPENTLSSPLAPLEGCSLEVGVNPREKRGLQGLQPSLE